MTALSTSYNVESGVRTTLKNTISPTTTANIQINYPFTITSGVLLFDPDTTREEYIAFGGATVLSGITTLVDVTRNLSKTANDFSGTGTGSQHSGGACTVELTNYHALYNLKANLDRANVFTAPQTIGGSNKLYFFDANTWVYSNGSDLYLKSVAQAEVSLSQLANLSGLNDKAKVSSNDTTPGYLNPKLDFNDGLITNIQNPGANETLQVNLDLANNSGLEFSGGQLKIKIKSGGGINIDANGVYFDTTQNLTLTGTYNFSSATLIGVNASNLVDSFTYNETITANSAVAIDGTGRVVNADGNILSDVFTVIGTAKDAGVLNDVKNVYMAGPTVPISDPGAAQGIAFKSHEQLNSNTSSAVWGILCQGQTFTLISGQTRIDFIDVNLAKVGNPVGTYELAVRATDGSGLPTGADLGVGSLAVASMASGLNRFTFNISGLTPGAKYSFYLRNASADVANHYAFNYQNTDVFANGNRVSSTDFGNSWTANATNDLRFAVYYKAVSGAKVYLSGGQGGLSLLPGTYFQQVGTALSPSEMMLNLGMPSIWATYSFSLPGNQGVQQIDTEITIGFRPRAVLMWADANGSYSAFGFWHHGANASGSGSQGDFDVNTTNAYKGTDPFNLVSVTDQPQTANHFVFFNIIAVSANSITIRRNVQGAALGTYTVRMLILG